VTRTRKVPALALPLGSGGRPGLFGFGFMAVHRVNKERGTIVLTANPAPTIASVSEDLDRVDQKLDRVLNELAEITRTLKNLGSSVADVQRSVDEKE
jgi:phage-related protein